MQVATKEKRIMSKAMTKTTATSEPTAAAPSPAPPIPKMNAIDIQIRDKAYIIPIKFNQAKILKDMKLGKKKQHLTSLAASS